MSSPPPPPPSSTPLEKVVAGLSAIVAQFPWIVALLGLYPVSIYQPGIYQDGATPWFLVVPAMAGVLAAWLLLRRPWVMLPVFVLAVAMALLAYWVYWHFPADDPIHKLNWILTYCVWSLAIAAAFRFVLDLTR